jgi:hypothetical protein
LSATLNGEIPVLRRRIAEAIGKTPWCAVQENLELDIGKMVWNRPGMYSVWAKLIA